MKKIAIKWSVRGEELIRIVKITGKVYASEHDEITSRILLSETVKLADLAIGCKGKLLPLKKVPRRKSKEFSYFEVIFKSNEDLSKFLKLLENRSS